MSLKLVNENLLLSNNIKYDHLFSCLEKINTKNLDYADLYLQSKHHEIWILENGIIKEGSYNIDQGIGARVIKGERTGFAYSNQITLSSLNKCIFTANNIVKESKKTKIINILKTCDNKTIYPLINPISNLSSKEKISLLQRINSIARSCDPRVQEVTATLLGTYEQILITATDGTLASDIRPLVQVSINVHVEQHGRREFGNSGAGGRFNYDFFLKEESGSIYIDKLTKEAVRIALINLSAIPAPAGYMPVILGSGWPGILLHEAVGHGLEGDFNRKKISSFSNSIGNIVASKLCTIVDDGTLNGFRGSINIDDEGVPSKYNVLIKNGKLINYMQDKLNARLMGLNVTGNGRRESYAHLPMPRMTNTYMLPHKSTKSEIINSVEKGIYATNFSGGQVDITSGEFVFSTSEAYLIENGVITTPVKGATIIGSGKEVMKQVSMVGNDLSFDKGVGTCGKEGQNIPVCVGQPTIKLKNITVGGTK